jgi:hypothetical protein
MKHNALAVCEFCGFLWYVLLIGGATYLIGWKDWSLWTYAGASFFLMRWSCRYCPGHALYDKTREKGE